MRVQRNKTKAQKVCAKDKIYQKRLEFQRLREMVNSLTDEEKQSEVYCGIVALVNKRIERKRLENIKYRASKIAYAKRKRAQQQVYEGNKLREREETTNGLACELDNYHFDIFDRVSVFDSYNIFFY